MGFELVLGDSKKKGGEVRMASELVHSQRNFAATV